MFTRTCLAGLMVLAGVWLGSAMPAMAQDARSYSCSFGPGVAQIYGKSAFKAEPAAPLAFDIAEIDAVKQTALQRSAKGEGPLRVVRAVGALHFLEVVSEGYLNITTVYDKDVAKGDHPAAHSRHFGVLGEPVVSQYHGFCTAK